MYELHDFARSSSAHRVRSALNLKGIEYESVPVALQEGGQHAPDFRSVNPQGMVPVYPDENILLSQSLAIIEYLDERYPDPPLLPRDIHERARARQFAYMIVADVHPLIAFRAISFLRDGFKIDTSGRREWFNYWLIEGLDALDLWLSAGGDTRRDCVGDQVTITDVCLVPQLEVARRNHIDLDDFPRLTSVETTCMALDAFRKAQPCAQAKSS